MRPVAVVMVLFGVFVMLQVTIRDGKTTPVFDIAISNQG